MKRTSLLILCCMVAACTTTQSLSPRETNSAAFVPWTEAPPVYRFAPGDRVRVGYLMTPELNEESVISPDGFLALRAAGRVRAVGLTADELDAAVAQASRRLLTNPIVTVSFNDPAAAVVFVGGSVRRSGSYSLAGRRGALEAVLLAGGFDTESRMDEVVLIRRSPDNKPMLRLVNLQNFVNTGGTAGDVPLFPGDILFVPRNRVSEFALWVDSFLNRIVPFNKAFSYTVTSGSAAVL